MGSGLSDTMDKWCVDRPGENLTYQCIGTERGPVCDESLHQDLKKVHVHLKRDNVSAVAYIQRMGGTHSNRLLSVAGELWDFCLEKDILLLA